MSKDLRSLVRGAVCALTAISASSALAADEPAGRYSMSPAEGGGVIRLDRETGAMSLCTGKEGEWTCKPIHEKAPTSAPTPQADATPPDQAPNDAAPPAPPGDLKMPTERDVDQLFDYVEGMVKKFKERIERLEEEAKKEPATPL